MNMSQYARVGAQHIGYRTYKAHIHVHAQDVKQSNVDVLGIVAGLSIAIAGYWAWPVFVLKLHAAYHVLIALPF